MSVVLRALVVEGEPGDGERVGAALRGAGLAVDARVVRDARELAVALGQGPWELLVFGEGPAGVSLETVWGLLVERDRDTPLVVLSEQRDATGAGEVIARGARDCLRRAELGRLPAVVARERAVSRLRHERAVLARVGETLAGSLDFDETLRRVVHLMVPELADWCTLYTPDEHEELQVRVSAHADPAQQARGAEYNRRYPLDPADTSGPVHVWRSGQARWVREIPRARFAEVSRSPEHLREVLALDVTSLIYVPLLGRRESQGVMTLCTTGARPRFVEADLVLFQDVARRVALALDNAWLYREAQEAIRLRDDFLEVAAHELRTPLTTLGLQLGSLVRQARRESSPALGERLERGLRQVRRLGALVESLLDVSLLSTGELSLAREPVDLAGLVAGVLERFQAEAAAVGCPLVGEVPPGLVGDWDRARVEQGVASLVANALKFGPRQPVEVRGERREGRARVVVEDRGIGVPAAHQEQIFERFGRAVSSRSYGGLGLGLYLARRAAEAHGGRLWVEPREGGGARFLLELPLLPLLPWDEPSGS